MINLNRCSKIHDFICRLFTLCYDFICSILKKIINQKKIDMEKGFNERESLQLINSMIAEARNNVSKSDGKILLFVGYSLVVISSIIKGESNIYITIKERWRL